MSHNAFFYGTLMAPQVLGRVIGHPTVPAANSALTALPALLHHHRRHRVRQADYPAILPVSPAENHSVRGTFVAGLSDADIWRLDRFEGDEYKRVRVRVSVQERKGEPTRADREAETYIWIAGRDRLEDEEWDFDDFVKEKMWRWADTSEEYEEVDRAVQEQADDADPTGGRAINGAFAPLLKDDDAGTSEQVIRNAV